MKKLRSWLATAIICIYACLTIILGELLALTVWVIIGDKHEACEMVGDIMDGVKHFFLD